ncbi:protein O-linked-mannose beta-1,2-N-acetylglucosaminyltransferase 1-like [Cherax quadricarinatus]|uniref:protein O-linked-mannose beta-1,2-N-acetylglucosaminyltransferase 1-like n=1 Tax=Cherax quadricarinatus TaxID=27406 RepID=UPI00387E381E
MVYSTASRKWPLNQVFLPCLLLLVSAGWLKVAVRSRLVSVNLTIALSDTFNTTKTMDIDEDSLKKFDITLEEFSGSLIRADDNGRVSEVVVGTRHIPLQLELKRDGDSITYSFGTTDGGSWSVSKNNFTNITIEDIRDDETLKPVKVSLEWSLAPLVSPHLVNLSLRSALLESAIHLDNTTLVWQKVDGQLERGQLVQLIPYSGIYLRVLNAYTHTTTLAAYFNTEDFKVDHELIDTLKNLRPGRLASITSYYDASGRLEASSKLTISDLGSFASRYLTFRDCWAWVWVVGGPTLAEGLVTNTQGINSFPPSLDLHLTLTPTPSSSERLCESWPHWWSKRQHFCDTYDGYGDLCSCYEPFTVSSTNTTTTTGVSLEELGVVVVAGNRPRYLYRLLRQLLTQPGVALKQVLVCVDGIYEETIKLLEVLDLEWRVHSPEGTGSPRISRQVRFALFHALEVMSTDKIIVLEEDLLLAPDFLSYMQQTAVLLDRDPSLFAVSAYAHFSYTHTAHDPTRLNRVHSLPAYGWMVKRSFLEETLPMWPPVTVTTDWDYWMGCGLVRRGRELVIPEVSRTAHAGLSGTHFSGLLTQQLFSNKPLSDDPKTVVNLTTVDREVYETELTDLLSKADPLNITDLYKFTFPTHGGVYAACVRMVSMSDNTAFKIVANVLGVWNRDSRDHHFGLWRLPYHQALILIIGVPYSKYSLGYMRGACPVLRATPEDYAHLMDSYDDQTYHFLKHGPNDYLNILELTQASGGPAANGVFEDNYFSSEAVENQIIYSSTPVEDQFSYSSAPVEDQFSYSSAPVEDQFYYNSAPVEDQFNYTNSLVNDQLNYTSAPVDDQFSYTNTPVEDQVNSTSTTVEDQFSYTSEQVADQFNFTRIPDEFETRYTNPLVKVHFNYTSTPTEFFSNYTGPSVENSQLYQNTS